MTDTWISYHTPQKKWAQWETERLIELRQKKFGLNVIATRLGRTQGSVEHKMRRLGIFKPQMSKQKWPDSEVEVLVRMASEGCSGSQIAKELPPRTRNSVLGKAHRIGISIGDRL